MPHGQPKPAKADARKSMSMHARGEPDIFIRFDFHRSRISDLRARGLQ
jgi:hypothetical protein